MSRRARARVLVTLFITALYWCWAVAESRLNFPRLSNEAGTITGVAIVNSRNQAATIVVTAYGDDGEILSGDGIRNPVEMIIEGNQQLALLTTDFFGTALPESTIGWFSVQSETNDLTGFFMFLDLEFSIFDGADLPVEAPAILLSEVRFGGGFSSEINIVNPGDLEADIELELWGEQSAVRQLLIPPHGVRRFEAGEFFGLNDSGATSFFSLTATSNTDIAAFELVKGPGDLLGLNAVPVDEPAKKVFFPQIAVLGGLNPG